MDYYKLEFDYNMVEETARFLFEENLNFCLNLVIFNRFLDVLLLILLLINIVILLFSLHTLILGIRRLSFFYFL